MTDLGFGKWSEESTIRLIPLWLFPFLAEEIETECIDGEKKLTKKKKLRWTTIIVSGVWHTA